MSDGRAGATARSSLPAAALAALGIVYGDLGTSPLYTLQTVVGISGGGRFTPESALGVLSLIVWTLILTVSIKYCLLVMRADNHGEGGIPVGNCCREIMGNYGSFALPHLRLSA